MVETMIDAGRLWRSLTEMARIGATPGGGVRRLALSEDDREARDLFAAWCREAGCDVRVDQVGNLAARRAGRRDDLPPVMTGSHLDTVHTGGRFDGVYGVLAGLEVIRSLNDRDIVTEAPIEVVDWTNEEGARFPAPMSGSGAFVGELSLPAVLDVADPDGVRLGDALAAIGYAGRAVPGYPVHAYLEAHIEQGPRLESAQTPIGVVTGVQAVRRFRVRARGEEAHAGTTPLAQRHDALVAAARIVTAVHEIGLDAGEELRATVGYLEVSPGAANVVPGCVDMIAEFRHPDAAVLDASERRLRDAAARAGEAQRVTVTVDDIWRKAATTFDADCVETFRRAARDGGYAHLEMMSGAGHDAAYLAQHAPAAMIFVPCRRGVSHNEAEDARPEDLAAGCDVLCRAILELAEA